MVIEEDDDFMNHKQYISVDHTYKWLSSHIAYNSLIIIVLILSLGSRIIQWFFFRRLEYDQNIQYKRQLLFNGSDRLAMKRLLTFDRVYNVSLGTYAIFVYLAIASIYIFNLILLLVCIIQQIHFIAGHFLCANRQWL